MSGLVTIRKSPSRSIHPPEPAPTHRDQCRSGPRPCPWYSCRHHLASDVHEDGTFRVDVDRSKHRPSCTLDVAGQPGADGKVRILDVEEISALTGLWHTNVEDALASGLAKLSASPELAEAWREVVQRDGGHPLYQAQRFADPAEEQIGGRPMGKERNGG